MMVEDEERRMMMVNLLLRFDIGHFRCIEIGIGMNEALT